MAVACGWGEPLARLRGPGDSQAATVGPRDPLTVLGACRVAAVPLTNCKGLPPAMFECSKWRAKFEEIDVNGDGEIQKEEIIER